MNVLSYPCVTALSPGECVNFGRQVGMSHSPYTLVEKATSVMSPKESLLGTGNLIYSHYKGRKNILNVHQTLSILGVCLLKI